MTNTRTSQQGFSLIEAMVSITIGLVLLAGFISVFMGSSSSYRKNDKTARLNDELSLAMAQITEDVEMAGFWGDLLDPSLITADNLSTPSTGTLTTAPTNDCFSGATYTDRSAFIAVDNNTSASPSAFPCITDAFTGSSDILAIKRVNGSPTRSYDGAHVFDYSGKDVTGSAPTLTPGRVYVRLNGNSTGNPPSSPTAGALFRVRASNQLDPVNPVTNIPNTNADGTSNPSGSSYSDWEYRTVVYYIRNFSNTTGDGVPTLCRMTLQGGSPPSMVTECFAQGIERLQVEFGIDTGTDAIPDYYASAPALTAAQIANAVALRVSLLARSVNIADTKFDQFSGDTGDYKNAKTYTVANMAAYTPADNLFRRLVTQAIVVRNPSNLRLILNKAS